MLKKIISQVGRIADYINAVTFAIMTLGVLIAVFARYLFRKPVPAGMELAYFAMLWCAFLQTGNAFLQGKHVSMSILRDRLSGKIGIIADMGISVVVLIVIAPMIWFSVFLAWESIVKNWRDAGSLGFPMFMLYGIMVLGLIYLGIVVLVKIIEDVKTLLGEEIDGS
jgi:TRAP-type C4-dicarboxylate transport system permease small subunit